MTQDTRDEPHGRGPVPRDLMALWVFAVATMDAGVLEAFATRIRRAWPASDLGPLEQAVADRRRVLGLTGAPGDAA